MNYEKYLPGLKSEDNFEVESTIDEISSIYDEEPKGEVRKLLLEFCFHKDPYIRRVAIRATAMHWSLPEAFEILKSMLTGGEENEEVLDAACLSINCFSCNHVITDEKINELYFSALSNELMPEKYRQLIYGTFLKYHNIISGREYADNSLKIPKNYEIDMDLVRKKTEET